MWFSKKKEKKITPRPWKKGFGTVYTDDNGREYVGFTSAEIEILSARMKPVLDKFFGEPDA